VNALAIQADGKLIVGGFARKGFHRPLALARYHADGSLDTGFGDQGTTITDFIPEGYSPVNDIALQSDAGIIIASALRFESDYDYPGAFDRLVVRYTADGHLDQSFAGGHLTKDFFGGDDVAQRVLIQPDGKIIVAGTFTSTSPQSFIERLNADGTTDASFGDNGVILAPFKEKRAQAVTLARQADGKLLLAASVSFAVAQDDVARQIALTRLNADGTPDASFGNGGIAVEDLASNNRVGDLLVQPDGKLVVVGNSNVSTRTSSLALLRFNADGARDDEFQSSAAREITGYTEANAAVMQSDGKIIVAGTTDFNFMVVRFESGLVIPPAPDFALESATPMVAGTVGEKVRITINVKRIGSFSGPVTITAPDTGTPKIVVNQREVATEASATFAFKIKRGAPKGDHPLVFKAKDTNGRERAVTVTLTVN
jgi:uncharacterized delta-60 repeat protein